MDALAKLGAMTDLPKTTNDIQDVDHILQRHFTMSKQGMLDSLMLCLSPPIFSSPFKHRILDYMGFGSGLMKSMLHFHNDMSPPERTWRYVHFMGQMGCFLGFYLLPVSVRVWKSCVRSPFWWEEPTLWTTAVQAREEFITISAEQAMQNICYKWGLSQLWGVLCLLSLCSSPSQSAELGTFVSCMFLLLFLFYSAFKGLNSEKGLWLFQTTYRKWTSWIVCLPAHGSFWHI